MDKIASFLKDHDKLSPGFSLSTLCRGVSTFDLRFKKPNGGEYLSTKSCHTIEHLLATELRNSAHRDSIVYFGPMGCRTGFYLLTMDLSAVAAKALLTQCVELSLTSSSIPGAEKRECGNYLDHDLAEARKDLSEYLALLKS